MPCEPSVRVWGNDKGAEKFFKLLCKGECNAGEEPCKPVKSIEGDAQLTVESCYCKGGKGDEVGGCHIVLCTSKDGTKRYRCDGKCDHADTEACLPVPIGVPLDVPIPTKGKYTGNKMGSYLDYKCECKPKANK